MSSGVHVVCSSQISLLVGLKNNPWEEKWRGLGLVFCQVRSATFSITGWEDINKIDKVVLLAFHRIIEFFSWK